MGAGTAVKSTDCSSRGLGSIPSTNMVVSQLSLNLVPADPMLFGLCRHCIHAGQTQRHKINEVSNFLGQGITMHPWLTWNPLCIEQAGLELIKIHLPLWLLQARKA